jgi:hypothetical protein
MATQYTGGLVTGQVLTAATMNSIGAAWEVWTPTVTAGTGTITTVGTVTCRYAQIQKVVFCKYDVSITTNGTGATYINLTLPVSAIATGTIYFCGGAGRETNVTGNMLQNMIVNATNVNIFTYNNAYPAGNGYRITGTIIYEAA